jgi:hypothetical protein
MRVKLLDNVIREDTGGLQILSVIEINRIFGANKMDCSPKANRVEHLFPQTSLH